MFYFHFTNVLKLPLSVISGGCITLFFNVIQGAASHPMGLYPTLQWPSEGYRVDLDVCFRKDL